MSNGYLTKSDLKNSGYGWTETAIKRFLGEPDRKEKNPRYRNAAPTLLFLESRVDAIEKTDEFQRFKAGNKQRVDGAKAGAKKGIVTKTNNLLEDVKKMKISVKTLPIKQVRNMAIDAYNEYNIERSNGKWASEYSDPDFLIRITANYIRHTLTTYDHHLESLVGRVGKGEAYDLLNDRIFDTIRKIYPDYMRYNP